MRIGLIIYGSLETMTGGYLYDRIVARGLTLLGHEVEVISLPGGSYLQQLAQGLSPGLCRRLLAGQFDLLLQDELCHPSLFMVNQQLRRLGGPPVVAIVHHIRCREPRPNWRNWLLALAEQRYLASVDGCIFNSETTRRTVTALVGDHRPQVIAYPAGDRFGSPLSLERIRQRTSQPGPLELLFLGILIPRKGLLPLLNALAGVGRDLWRLTVAGGLDFDPAHTDEVRQRIQQLGLAGSVRLVGPCGDEALIELLNASHVFCMPYAYEGFGIAMLEAMAFGLPAIGSLTGAAAETVSQENNGFLLAPDDLAGLEPLLVRLQQDRNALFRLSLAARATYAARPGWQDNIAAIHGFLQSMHGGSARGRFVEPSQAAGTAPPRDTSATK